MEIEKNPVCQQIMSVTQLTFVEWRSALKKEEKKPLKQISSHTKEKFKASINFSVYIFLC